MVVLLLRQPKDRLQRLLVNGGAPCRWQAWHRRFGHDATVPVIDDQTQVHGVERVDVSEDAVHLVGGCPIARVGRQQMAKGRRHGPPAAIVGPLVQVAVQQVHRQVGDETDTLQARGQHGVVEVAHRLLAQQNLAKCLLQHGTLIEREGAMANRNPEGVEGDAGFIFTSEHACRAQLGVQRI